MKYKLLLLLCFFTVAFLTETEASARKKKKETAKTPVKKESAYDKLFKKDHTQAKGLINLHRVDNKLYFELPLQLLGKDMLLGSTVTEISDNGDAIVGQKPKEPLHIQFTMIDSTIQLRQIFNYSITRSEDKNIANAIEKANIGAIIGVYKVEAYNPDSTAVVFDITKLFVCDNKDLEPIDDYGANTYGGYLVRSSRFQQDKSFLGEIKAFEDNVLVRSHLSYECDIRGGQNYYEYKKPLTVVATRSIVLLPEIPARPRIADPRVGIFPTIKIQYTNTDNKAVNVFYANRWRLEPSDEIAFKKGQLVEPKKPIVFYLDTLMPESWTKYVRAGIEEWNKAFERIGFKNVLRAVPFPGTSDFDAGNIQHSVIRYSPTSPNMYRPQQSMLVDNRSGEILNASLYLHHHFLFILHRDRLLYTMAADPEARKAVLSEEVMGQLIKSQMVREIGSCLGLRSNLRASSVYPVDSLRSATFTREHGLSPSIMDMVPYNYVAQEEDVKNGVMLVQDKLGEYDYYAIEWLYKPIRGVKNADEERDTLDHWIKESRLDIAKTYGHTPFTSNVYDPRILSEDLGNDHVKAGEYLIKNLKKSMAHCREWFAEEDKTLELQNKLYVFIQGRYMDGLNRIASYIGGMYINEGNSDENVQHYAVVPKAKQREAINFLLAQAKDLEWLDNQELRHDLRVSSSAVQQKRMDIFGLLFSRWYMVIMSSRKASGGYTADEYMDELYRMVWEGTIKRRKLDPLERDFQMAFLAAVIASSTVTEDAAKLDAHTKALAQGISSGRQLYDPILCEKMERMQVENISGFYAQEGIKVNTLSRSHVFYQMLLKIDGMVNNAIKTSTGEMKDYYEYLHYKIRQALDVEGIR